MLRDRSRARPRTHPVLSLAPFALAFGALLLLPGVALAQRRPFPQNGGYTYGFLPNTVGAKDALASYRAWKAKYLKSDCGGGTYRVEFTSPRGSTVSEGQGYGMVLTAYFGDRTEFDGLWKFAQKNFAKEHGLMGWKVSCTGFFKDEGGSGSATDGDNDIGLALVAAVDQWGEEYRQPAMEYLAKLKKVDFEACEKTGRVMAKAGDWGDGCEFSNTSYWMPGYYRVFAQFTGDSFWKKAADDAVELYLISRNPVTGLAPNEVDEHGAPHDNQTYVDYNGARTPWRLATEYAWYGTPGAKDALDKMTDWAESVGIAKLVDGYHIDGRPRGQYTMQNPWIGGWACGAVAKSQYAANRFGAAFKAIDDDEGGYYGSSLRSLYLLFLSGNFWRPLSPLPAHAGVGSAPAGADATASVTTADSAAPGASAPSGGTAAPSGPPPTSMPAGCGGCGCASNGRSGASGAAVAVLAALALRRRKPRDPGGAA